MTNLHVTFTAILLALTCFGLLSTPKGFGVVPPPDGGYPGGNTAEGQSALLNLTTGGFNTAVGFFSLRSDTIGQRNTAIGAGALLVNTADDNTATGAGTLLSTTTGFSNTANGAFALSKNTTGSFNTALGDGALFNNTTSNANTGVGNGALSTNTTGANNTATGVSALLFNTTGPNNTANGAFALQNNSTGGANTASGEVALHGNSTGNGNTANGHRALFNNDTGSGNTAVGDGALSNNTTGIGNTVLGFDAGANVATASSVICIGAPGQNVNNSCYIGQIFSATSASGTAVFVNPDGKLGTATSSRQFKEDIKPMERASEAILALKPVAFRYKKEIDPIGTSQFGLVAEDVEKVNPDLVVRDQEGKTYSVRYDAVNAMLLNEFLKEHRRGKEQQASIAELKSTVARQQEAMEVLTADVKEQATQIQKVSAQIRLDKRTRQMVLNNP
jgi:trimeric autotransporter adhesin